MTMKKMFGAKLRELRRTRQLTQEQMSEFIGISPENYSRIENGLSFPKPENIVKISHILGVEIYELFQFLDVSDTQTRLEKIINKLQSDEQTTAITYKFLSSIGKI